MSHQGFENTFEEFKKQFYSKIGDGTCFNVLDINLFKVILDGLKVQYSSRGKVAHYFDKPTFVFYVYLFVKYFFNIGKRKVLNKAIKKHAAANILIGFSDRYLNEDSRSYPLYFQRFFNEFGREKFYYITENNNNKINADFCQNELVFGFNFFSLYNIKLYYNIKKFINKLEDIWTPKEQLDIKIACFIFYINYLKWDFFLKHRKISKIIIEQHYHREGLILACKNNNISVNELQHGLIAKEDIFYVIPHQVSGIISKALFPDKIFVYGNYWKKVLLTGCEFKERQIIELGYYHYDNMVLKSTRLNQPITAKSKNIILITTQYSAEIFFIDYVKLLSPKLGDEWEIVLKPHPVEKNSIYEELEKLHNVSVVQGNLNELINSCKCLVSIFSTTIFDAVRMGKPAFSLYFPIFADYVNGIVSSGAAYLLTPEDNPVEKYTEIALANQHVVKSEFYSEFNKNTCMTMLLNDT